jgi:hypothetical protein
MKKGTLAIALLLASYALAQPAPPALRGTWTATAGPKDAYRGKWSAQALPGTPNAAHGSWALLNDAGHIVTEGTWSAQKSAHGWHGTWSAHILLGRPSFGRPLSGTWQAQVEDFKGKTFEGMLQRTLERQIAGSWRSGRLQGNWWLKGSPW